MRLRFLCAISILFLLLLVGCDQTGKEVRIGFMGGLSDRNLDIGQSGLNAVVLAVEQINRDGGINGRLVALVSRDDAQSKDVAAKAANELASAKVTAVIGPFTSSMAAAVMPVFDRAGILVISPTISSMDFYGKDDYLVRMNRTTRDNARDYAHELCRRGRKRIAVALDMRNRAFTESWFNEFRVAMGKLAGASVERVDYESAADTDFSSIVRAMLDKRPDGLLFISGAVDVARFAQQARRLSPHAPISASEWAGSEQLLNLGGEVVDGLLIVQNFYREDTNPRYVAFREAYYRRFGTDPGYASVMAYDAAMVLFEALQRKSGGETAKEAVLKYGPYQGLQQRIEFDANGDSEHKVYFTEIHNGMFKVLR